MAETFDHLFVSLKAWVLGRPRWPDHPEWLKPLIGAALSIGTLIGVFASLFAVTTILERTGLGRIQNSCRPTRVGPFGLLQPAADGIKALIKEDIVPSAADKVVHFLAPLMLVIPSFL